MLTGGPEPAERVVASVLRVQPELRKLAAYQRDRLLIQHSRAVRHADAARAAAFLGVDGVGAGLVGALRELAPQQREAWVLMELEGYETIPAARAMDCSKTAMARFLEEANDLLTSLLGDDYAPAVERLRAAIDDADPEPSMRRIAEMHAKAMARRRWWIIARFAIAFAIMGLVFWVAMDLIRRDRAPANPGLIPDAPGQLEPSPEELERRRRLEDQADAPPAGREISR